MLKHNEVAVRGADPESHTKYKALNHAFPLSLPVIGDLIYVYLCQKYPCYHNVA